MSTDAKTMTPAQLAEAIRAHEAEARKLRADAKAAGIKFVADKAVESFAHQYNVLAYHDLMRAWCARMQEDAVGNILDLLAANGVDTTSIPRTLAGVREAKLTESWANARNQGTTAGRVRGSRYVVKSRAK